MDPIEQLLENEAAYAEKFPGEAPHLPQLKVAVVTCMDCRIDVETMLGVEPGQIHVIRNAGGLVTPDTIRTLTASQRSLGTEYVMLIQHTDCGMSRTDDEEFLAQIEKETGQRPDWRPGGFKDVDESVKAGMKKLLDSPFVGGTVRGFVLDIKNGGLREVTL
ncbi:beta-class carbonic anhydrase [Varibaculum massiliense]|uniref:beta-class carbonic anhydrase n=1 Tax=Varibaculum massiliense TaxID=1852372 RepID=UPI0008D94E43|nr:carbonic anhydrase [Varibaculum massiliense]